jgi:hypothetical protein
MTGSAHLETVRRGSRILAPLCLLAAIVWPLVEAGWMLWTPGLDLGRSFSVNTGTLAGIALRPWQRLLLVVLGVVPALAASLGLWGLGRCFRLFGEGEFFSVATVRWLRRCSGWTFCTVALELVTHPLVTVVLTAYAPAGEHEMLLSLGAHNLQTLLVAGAVWVIAGAMAEAGRMADENAAFV